MKAFRTMDLSVEFYELSEKSELKGNLRDQLLRAASSIALNLPEGNAKPVDHLGASLYRLLQSEIRTTGF
jgi:four helix bundle protein